MSNFANIDPTTLDDVTGGTTPASSHCTAGNAALTSQLSSLQSSISSLAQPQQNKSVFSDPTTAMMFGLALSRQNSQPTVVAGASPVVYVGGGRRHHWW